MCGRYSLTSDMRGLEDRFEFRGDGLAHVAREQLYPTNNILTVVHDSAGPRSLGSVTYHCSTAPSM